MMACELAVLQEGARVQLEGGQINCGMELALLLAEVLALHSPACYTLQ